MQEAIDPLIPAYVKNHDGAVDGTEVLHLQRRLLLHEPRQQAQDRRLEVRLHAARRARLAPRRPDGDPRRLRTLRHTHRRSPTPSATRCGEIDLGAYSPITNVLSSVERRAAGLPAANPFPQGLTPAYGKALRPLHAARRLRSRSTSTSSARRSATASTCRSSASCRSASWRTSTYLVNFVSHDQYSQNLNLMDPRLTYTYGALIDAGGGEPVLQLRHRRDVPRGAAAVRDRGAPASCCGPTRSTATSSRPAPTCAAHATSRCSCACSGRSRTASRSWSATPT